MMTNKDEFIKKYMDTISTCKTEREWVSAAELIALTRGFNKFNSSLNYKPGDKVYFINRKKNFAAFVIGKDNTSANLLGAHIDSPRIDVKQQPLYESSKVAYFDTQYYGGIKKYQWTTIPLAIHGIIIKANGETINVNIGEKPNDPVFCITDLLPHLSRSEMSKKTAEEFINGEKLDIIVGTTPVTSNSDDTLKTEEKEPVKKFILNYLKENWLIEDEEDFCSAELEIVPAGPAHFSGLDKSLVAAYGQDDRVCAFTSLMSVVDLDTVPEHTSGVILVDKEEIGSCGATGAKSRWFEDVLRCVFNSENEVKFASSLHNSKMLSSDVTAAFDPLYADVYDKKSSAKLGDGIMFSKYNGGRGKSGGADANPEFIAYVRNIMKFHKCKYQFDSMGKVDQGGGGTIASMVADLNINVLDAGVPVLNMHSPMELAHVNDIYAAYEAYTAFIKE
jgi:aspartyl aminopeptidase